MSLPPRTDVAVIGAGHAGLTMSWYLGQAGVEHVVLDRRPRLGGGWQDRWDGFRLVSPNWTTSFPGDPYHGPDRDAFMSREEVIDRVAGYGGRIGAPVHVGVEVRRLSTGGPGFRVETGIGDLFARQVVVAIGSFHRPHVPEISVELPSWLSQVHTDAYRNPSGLPAGAVLVVGSGQSGVQIADELREAGREVYLSVGSAGRVPRRYRGRDFFYWLAMVAVYGDSVGASLPTVDTMVDPRQKLAANPQLSGHHGDRDVDLRRMAEEGLHLVGRIDAVEGQRLRLRADMSARLSDADAFFGRRFQPIFDDFIAKGGMEAPLDDRGASPYEPAEPRELDLRRADISTVIWATGYRPDFTWIDLPIHDGLGFPRQNRGVSDVPGLYFLGLTWQYRQTSATLRGPALDARYLIERMGLRPPVVEPPAPLAPPPTLLARAPAGG